MNLVLYSDTCFCALRGLSDIKKFASKHNINLIKRRTRYNTIYKQEAQIIGERLPFLYNETNGRTIRAIGITEERFLWLTA